MMGYVYVASCVYACVRACKNIKFQFVRNDYLHKYTVGWGWDVNRC